MNYENVLRLLTETCLQAVQCDLADRTHDIEMALRCVLLDETPLCMSIAMGHLELGHFDKAESIVTSVIDKESESFYAKAVLGFVLQVAGKEGWQDHYEMVLSQSTDTEARNLARQGLSLVNK